MAGVEIGRISGVEVEKGVAVVDVEVEHKYDDLIREDATALLRPKTALKDMFIEVTPGTGKVLQDGGRIPVANTLPDVDPDEIYASLDSDTRPYLKLLVSGAGKGLRGRGADLQRGVPAPRARRTATWRASRGPRPRGGWRSSGSIHRYGLLMPELGRRPGELRRLVSASRAVFGTLAGESGNISTSVARLPGSLRATESALAEVRQLRAGAPELARVAARADPRAARDQRGAHAVLQSDDAGAAQPDPPVRARGAPFTNDLRIAANDLAKATPDLTTVAPGDQPLLQHGRLQPGRRRGPGRALDRRSSARARRASCTGWPGPRRTGSRCSSSADGQGRGRRVTICGVTGGRARRRG